MYYLLVNQPDLSLECPVWVMVYFLQVHMTNMDVNAFTQDLGWGSFAPER